MRPHLRGGIALMSLVVLLAVGKGSNVFGQAGGTPGQAPPPIVAPQAQQILQSMAALLRSARTWGCEVQVQANVPSKYGIQPATMRYVFAAQRPDRMAVAQRTDFTSPTVVCDGQSLHLFQPAQLQYTQKTAPASLASIEERDLADAGEGLGVLMYWMLQNDPYQAILRDTREARYVGQDMTNGVTTQHVTLVQVGWNADIWVQADRPVIRQVHLTQQSYATLPLVPHVAGTEGRRTQPRVSQDYPGLVEPNAQPEVTMTFGSWTVGGKLPDGTFQFAPPAGARKIGAADAPATKPPADSLQGEPVPPVTFRLMGSGHLTPAKMKGKVVVLGFWSVAAEPSLALLPTLMEIASQYRSKGVAVYAVNCGDTPAQISGFLAQAKAHIPVAMDKAGEGARQYKIKALPQVMIVDKAGIVQAADVPVGPHLKQDLQKAIEAALAGKGLASGT